jgi:hypothetical protein
VEACRLALVVTDGDFDFVTRLLADLFGNLAAETPIFSEVEGATDLRVLDRPLAVGAGVETAADEARDVGARDRPLSATRLHFPLR